MVFQVKKVRVLMIPQQCLIITKVDCHVFLIWVYSLFKLSLVFQFSIQYSLCYFLILVYLFLFNLFLIELILLFFEFLFSFFLLSFLFGPFDI